MIEWRTRRLSLPGWVSLSLLAVGAAAAPAPAQTNANRARQRYDANTKAASVEDAAKQLSSGDPEKRLQAVKSLGMARDGKALEYLIKAVGDPDLRVQAKAVQMLGDARATEATPVLVQYLVMRTTDANMQQLILASLGKIGDMRAAQPLIDFLQRDLDAATRATAIFALGDIGAPESVGVLTRIAQTDSDPTIRRVASDARNKIEAHHAAPDAQTRDVSEPFFGPRGSAPAEGKPPRH